MAERDGAGRWGPLGAAVLAAVVGFVFARYAQDTHQHLVWELCHKAASVPGSVWAAAIVAPLLSLGASVGAGWLAVRARRRPVLLVAAMAVSAAAGFCGLLEAFGAVDTLAVDHSNGNTCMA
ncbi:hypothetical protein ACFVHB_02980 [Kitasatospora sp. NPDC127111]|uniref:hypothetical protein n=1 Tax=Kitasatospora sp. NPDC127111 TaxID=3345363 RepID=UPI00363DC1E3